MVALLAIFACDRSFAHLYSLSFFTLSFFVPLACFCFLTRLPARSSVLGKITAIHHIHSLIWIWNWLCFGFGHLFDSWCYCCCWCLLFSPSFNIAKLSFKTNFFIDFVFFSLSIFHFAFLWCKQSAIELVRPFQALAFAPKLASMIC